MEPTLNIIIYGKNIVSDIKNIVYYDNIELNENPHYEKTYFFKDKIKNWEYYLIQSEYDKKANLTIFSLLKEHYIKKYSVI